PVLVVRRNRRGPGVAPGSTDTSTSNEVPDALTRGNPLTVRPGAEPRLAPPRSQPRTSRRTVEIVCPGHQLGGSTLATCGAASRRATAPAAITRRGYTERRMAAPAAAASLS